MNPEIFVVAPNEALAGPASRPTRAKKKPTWFSTFFKCQTKSAYLLPDHPGGRAAIHLVIQQFRIKTKSLFFSPTSVFKPNRHEAIIR